MPRKARLVYIEMLLNPGWQHKQTALAILRILQYKCMATIFLSCRQQNGRDVKIDDSRTTQNRPLLFRYKRTSSTNVHVSVSKHFILPRANESDKMQI